MSQYSRENPEQPIRHDWLEGARRAAPLPKLETSFEMPVSSCCHARFLCPGWPDNDICSICHEHCGAVEETEEE